MIRPEEGGSPTKKPRPPLVPAVVINADNITALSVIRSLGRNDIPVIAVFGKNRGHNPYRRIVNSSRFIASRTYFDETDYENEWLRCLLDVSRTLFAKPVLFPVSDLDMSLVSKNRDKLKNHYHLLMPSAEMVDILLKKEKFYDLAVKMNLPIPRTFYPTKNSNINAIAEEVRYPCIIKPSWRDGTWVQRYGNRKVFFCGFPLELKETIASILPNFDKLTVQEVVPGPESNIICTFTFLDEQSNPLGMFICRKIRQFPPYFGNTSLAESASDSEAAELTSRLGKRLGLKGYLSVEFKRDQGDMALKILEVTSSRCNRQVGLSDECGMNIPYFWYCHMLGLKTNVQIQNGSFRWASEVNEVRSICHYIRVHDWTLRNWLRSYRDVKRWEVYARDDIHPFIMLILSMRLSHFARNL